MNIKKIIINNFFSFKHAEIELSKYKGITLIKGKNQDSKGSNGSGKSIIFEAVYFGLTGKTIRRSIEEGIVNNQEGRGCSVEVHLNDGIVIKRCKRPTMLELTINGKSMNKANAIETQEEIDRLLNTNYKILSSSMFFGQGNDLNFLDASAEDKRTIIKGFLNLDDVFQYRDRIKDYKSHFLTASKTKTAVIDSLRQNKDDIEKKIKSIALDRKEYDSTFDSMLHMSLDGIIDIENKYKADKKAIVELKVREIVNSSLIGVYKHSFDRMSGGVFITRSETCGQCSSVSVDTETERDLEESARRLSEEEANRLSIEAELKIATDGLVEPVISSDKFSSFLKYKELCKEELTYSSLITDLEDKIKFLNSERVILDRKYEVMRFWEKAFSEQGVIKYIIRNILTYLNERINFYLSFISNSKYFLIFDEELNEKITTNGKELRYISLSGGEKRKINLVVMLALRDLLVFTDKDKTNLMFFDEVAENLDDEGVYGLYLLLDQIKKERNVFIITHNKHLDSLLDSCKKINVVKKNGISKITR